MTSQAPSHLTKIVADNLDRAMSAKDLTNRALGEKIGKTEHQVWRWRKGRHMPEQDSLIALAVELFDGDVSQFYVTPEAVPS